MKILTDETVATSTVALLRELGHDVLDIHEAGLAGSTDERVMSLAKSESRVIITHDKDFGDLARVSPESHCGAVILRLRNATAAATNGVLTVFLRSTPDDSVRGKLVILTESGFRSRRMSDMR